MFDENYYPEMEIIDLRKISPNATASSHRSEGSINEPDVKNPFYHRLNPSFLNILEMTFCFFFVLPFRCLGVAIFSSALIFISTLTSLGLSDKRLKERPMIGWRKKTIELGAFLARAVVFCCGFHYIKTKGRRAKRHEAPIFVAAPHSSFLDSFAFPTLGFPSSVCRYENAKFPILGRVLRTVQPILVNRADFNNKIDAVNQIVRRTNLDEDWPQLIIFPEGTTTNRSCLISFKPGAFIPGVPVQPVVFNYKNKLNTTSWTILGLSGFQVLLYTMCQLNNKLEIHYLPIYYPNKEEKQDAFLYASNVRDVMAKYLDLPTTSHSFEDVRLMHLANHVKVPKEAAIIEFGKLQDKLKITIENCEDLFEKFCLHARRSDGKMTLKEFCDYLNIPPSDAVINIFNLYDRDKNGLIDFREFVIGLSLLTRPSNVDYTVKLLIQMFDKEGLGVINVPEMETLMYSLFMMSPEDVQVLIGKLEAQKITLLNFDGIKI